jgi:hypothetical protein
MTGDSVEKKFHPFGPSAIPDNTKPTNPGNFNLSKIIGTVKITIKSMARGMIGSLPRKFDEALLVRTCNRRTCDRSSIGSTGDKNEKLKIKN